MLLQFALAARLLHPSPVRRERTAHDATRRHAWRVLAHPAELDGASRGAHDRPREPELAFWQSGPPSGASGVG